MIAPAQGLETLLANLEGVKSAGADKWQACCPAHDDSTASLSIAENDGVVLLKCHAGCETAAVVAAAGLSMADLFPPRQTNGGGRHIDKTYDYRDADGMLVFQVVKYFPKDFRQRKPDGRGGWEPSVKGVKPVPYRLFELTREDPTADVFIPEGEKDVDRLRSLGLTATCNAGGAGKWKAEFAHYLVGRNVVILPDNDDVGRAHAKQVADSLLGKAASVKIVELPGLAPKGDVSDWLNSGHSVDETLGIVGNAEVLSTSTVSTAQKTRPYIPFPIDALPSTVGKFVAASASAIGCDPSFTALPTLACLARSVGNARVIQLKRTWSEPSIIWAAIVGKSGTHKSPAVGASMKALRRKEEESFAGYADLQEKFEQEKACFDRDMAAWKKLRNNTEPPPFPPEEPHCTRYVTSDTTIEALASILCSQFDGILLYRDELAGWLNFDEYKNGKGSGLGHWLSCWSAEGFTVDRKTGTNRTQHVKRAAVSVVGGIQPGILRGAIGREHLMDGLAARLLLAMPTPRPVRWTEDAIDEQTEQSIERIYANLFSLEPGVDADGNFYPIPLEMTPEAKSLWVAFFDRHREESAVLDDDLAAAWSKLEAYCARFALIFQCCEWAAGEADLDFIDESSMKSAIRLADWFGGEAQRVYQLFSESEADSKPRELLEIIHRRGGTATARDLMRCSRRFTTSAEADAALEQLVKAGEGKWETLPPGPAGGKPTRRFQIVDSVDVDETPITSGKR